MTAKEKAKELVSEFTFYQLPEGKRILFDDAKRCAFICVDEILEGSRLFYIEDYYYWKEVKEEINKL